MIQALTRHVKQRCKIANSDEGMDQLMNHTLQRQLAEQNTKIDELTKIVRQLATGQTAVAAPAPVNIAPVVNNTVVNNNNSTTINNTIVVNPWDSSYFIKITPADITAMFAENQTANDYVYKLEDRERTDPKTAPTYIYVMFMDLVKRSHADPISRNIYQNPRRADQVMVFLENGRWALISNTEAIDRLFQGVADKLHKIIMTDAQRRELLTEHQNAIAWAEIAYKDEPQDYVKLAKPAMSAHFANMAALVLETLDDRDQK